ncbi:Asp-tRNA(Asn)/Glu-tRNA(Gln) amidotransferase subunit GatC [Chlamydia sp. 17-3921]|uniref:Asp-tRNA(Asn)/Glu-tRNA(Gln) amidotransferase subunit GatC n=1 Tax=Chlamydia sp. 17-3921 TaxID=2675798 RepID=UPI001918FBDC|nr:Asp-tRNA(Asn)/Glu-tRNA(Gln) amidotransferase subunit GatC [Chlamydia sp. 17-3921]
MAQQSYVDKQEVLLLAKSSALQLSDELAQEYSDSLNEIIGTMEATLEIEVADISSEELLTYVVGPEDLREDIVDQSFSRQEFLYNVPESLGGLVKVPTVMK